MVNVVRHSQKLAEAFDNLTVRAIRENQISFMKDDEPEVPCDDTIFIGEEDFCISETDDGKFYARPCRNNPFLSYEEYYEKIVKPITDDLEDGILPIVSDVQEKYFYGAYFDTFEDALTAIATWSDPNLIPKCYTPPITTIYT